MSRIELRGISKRFGDTPVLNDIDLSTIYTPGAQGYTDYPAFA